MFNSFKEELLHEFIKDQGERGIALAEGHHVYTDNKSLVLALKRLVSLGLVVERNFRFYATDSDGQTTLKG